MYKVNKQTKQLEELKAVTYKELECKERKDLQEWICNQPSVLGEELLIIQKEFDGFTNTNERADLVAVDKQGNLVIIENKLDTSGRDVVWQGLKYASYFSTASKDEIRSIFQKYLEKYNIGGNAEDKLTEFFGKQDFTELTLNTEKSQRIIFVARDFRSEVTSAVMYLIQYGLKIKCIRIVPYQNNHEILLDVEQIIPQKDIAVYMNKVISKSVEEQQHQNQIAERHILRSEFWKQFLAHFQSKSNVFDDITAENNMDNWLSKSCGISGMNYIFSINLDSIKICLQIGTANKDDNKKIYDELSKSKNEIENIFAEPLEWNRCDSLKKSELSLINYTIGVADKSKWNEINEWLTEKMIKLEKTFKPYILKLRATMKSKS